jgi:histone acetyltransferase (RNA polymerase elongator complex component)
MERWRLRGLAGDRAVKKLPFFLPFGGCRGRCVYCNQQTITGVAEVPQPEYVREVLSKLDAPREVCFFGGSFCRFPFDTVKAYLDAVSECAPQGSRIRFSTYPGDLDDPKMFELVASHDIACIEFGVQSLDPHVLAACRREADPEEIFKSIVALRNASLPVGVQLMIGLPGQTIESSLRDITAISEIKGELGWDLRLYPCLVIAGTELEHMMQRGEFKPLSLPDAIKWGGEFIDLATRLGFNPIRVGLQESELLASQVRGGPHHPALGEMIASYSLVQKLIRASEKGPWLVPSAEMSKFTGHNDFGLGLLAERAGIKTADAKERLKFF